jgi:hypothetical protein
MGCHLACAKRSDRQPVNSGLIFDASSYTAVGADLTLINESELAQILNDIHLCPFPENRAQILQSRLATRLITCAQLGQILKMLESDEEKLARLKALFGNVSDPSSNWAPIHELFENEKVKEEVVILTATKGRRNSLL